MGIIHKNPVQRHTNIPTDGLTSKNINRHPLINFISDKRGRNLEINIENISNFQRQKQSIKIRLSHMVSSIFNKCFNGDVCMKTINRKICEIITK